MSIPLRLLVLHDSPSDAELFVRELTGAGFEPDWKLVETEGDFLAALGPLIDLVLANRALPGYDGLTALRQMRERGLDIPFIIVSRGIRRELAVSALKQGAADCLALHQLSRLGPAVSQALERRDAQRKTRRAEAALRESERRLRDAQALGRVGCWERDIEGGAVDWSDQAYVLYERDLALGPPTADEEATYYSPEQAQLQRDYGRRATEEGRGFQYDLEVNLPSGKHCYFAVATRPIKDAQGRVVKLFGTVQDVTERSRVEDELRESEQRYRQLVDESPFAIAVLQDGNIVFVNSAAL